jgi:hypothetical protein
MDKFMSQLSKMFKQKPRKTAWTLLEDLISDNEILIHYNTSSKKYIIRSPIDGEIISCNSVLRRAIEVALKEFNTEIKE